MNRALPVRKLSRAALRLSLTTFIVLLVIASVFGQQGRGTLLGTITDPSNAAIAGAEIKVTNTNTNLEYTAIANNEGFYNLPNLPVGNYSIAVARPGFKRAVRTGLTLEVDQKAQVDFALEAGAITETLEIKAETSLVDTTTATFGKVIENRRVQDLPVNGRNALSLVLLAPSVQSAAGPTASGFGDRGTQVSLIRINGGPFATNNLLVDGLSSTNVYVPDVNINPNVDAVQEFKVQTNTMSSE